MGILKGRFRILKTGIRLHTFEAVDNIWKTCCALHNWLLHIDGLDVRWNTGNRGMYEGPDANHDVFDIEKFAPGESPSYDPTHIGHPKANGHPQGLSASSGGSSSSVSRVSELNLQQFRRCLIDHFSRKWHANEV